MLKKLFILLSVLLLGATTNYAQNRGVVEGTITSAANEPIPLVNIVVLPNSTTGVTSNENGKFELTLPYGTYQLYFSHSAFNNKVVEVNLNRPKISVTVKLSPKTRYLEGVTIQSKEDIEIREQASTIQVSPATLKEIPTPFLDFNQSLVSGGGLGIMSNNELSSSYSVRGGNFDENLVYVNDILIYRPFLVRSGQQEGLSFVNPEMVAKVDFSSGGWQPKYGDKLSSVLNIQYKAPQETHASLIAGLLGGSAHIEGSTPDKSLSFISGFRYKSAQYLLNTLDVQGQYLPRFGDFQTYLEWRPNKNNQEKTKVGFLLNYASNFYQVEPEEQVTRFGTFQQVFRLRTAFEGNESLQYSTWQGGLKLAHQFNKRFESQFITSALITREREFVNLEGGYLLCDVDNNLGSNNFNDCATIIGLGTNFDYARNFLAAQIFAVENRNVWNVSDKTKVEFGFRVSTENIDDQLNEYSFTDSADFVSVQSLLQTDLKLQGERLSGYLQQTVAPNEVHSFTYGVRANYWTVNQQWLISPRSQYSIAPKWQRDIIFTAALGSYQQAPFYRELRDFEGVLNQDLKGQSSMHAIVGMDWNFTQWNRPFKFITEIYHKQMWNVVAYDVDNIRLRYYADNDTRAYATGIDFRLSGEFIPNTESWFNLSIMEVKEDKENDGRGYIRRPSDQRLTFALFFRDHLPNNPSIRMHIRYLYGTGLPYGPPNSLQFRNALGAGTKYNRADVGFSKVIAFENEKSVIKSFWFGLEILNLFGVNNNISFNWLEDFNDNQYAVPNSLSQRFFNLRLIARY